MGTLLRTYSKTLPETTLGIQHEPARPYHSHSDVLFLGACTPRSFNIVPGTYDRAADHVLPIVEVKLEVVLPSCLGNFHFPDVERMKSE